MLRVLPGLGGLLCRISEDRGYLSVFAGMWAGYELSVTRALGHKNLEAYGVLCEPAVTTLQLQPEDTCLVSCPPGRGSSQEYCLLFT